MPKFAAASLEEDRGGCNLELASLAQLARARDL